MPMGRKPAEKEGDRSHAVSLNKCGAWFSDGHRRWLLSMLRFQLSRSLMLKLMSVCLLVLLPMSATDGFPAV